MPHQRTMLVLLALAACWGAYKSWQQREYDQLPGILVAGQPEQSRIWTEEKVFQKGEYAAEAQARYRIRARILSRLDYSLDAGAAISPMDLTLGWGPMSDSSILDQMEISQSTRFYQWRTPGPPPLPEDVINRHAANTHLIPADSRVLDALRKMRKGQVVELSGFLVNVKRPDGWNWNTSLTRDDRGAGACELMWVENARIL